MMIYGIEWYSLSRTTKIYRFVYISSQIKSSQLWFGEFMVLFFLAIYQSYAAAKAREYLDKPALHETMVKVFFISRNCGFMKTELTELLDGSYLSLCT